MGDEERLAKALAMKIESIRRKRDLLNGICEEVVEMLKDRNFSSEVTRQIKKMKPQR